MALSFYPNDFQARFGEEMVLVFEQASASRRDRGRVNLLVFVTREIAGLLGGAARERLFKSNRNSDSEELAFPSDVAEAESYVRAMSARLIGAIANHDFVNARYYDEQDRKARALLRALNDGNSDPA